MSRAAFALALAASGTSVFLLAPPAASAVEECGAPVPLNRSALPAADATGVPLNSRVVALLAGRTHRDLYVVRLRVAGGADVATTTRDVGSGYLHSAVFLTPDAPLEPGTTYEILDDLEAISGCDLGGPTACDDATTQLAVVSSFTTGDSLDTTAPVFAPTFLVSHGETSCDVPDCCGAYHAFTYGVSFTAATDDEPVLYDVTQAGHDTPAIEALDLNGFTGANYCYIEPPTEGVGADVTGPGPVVVRAVDLAGNVTAAPPHELQVPACPPEDQPPHDAGPGFCDGGSPYADGGIPTYPDGPAGTDPGCDCSVGGAHDDGSLATVVAGILLTLGVAFRRVRRR